MLDKRVRKYVDSFDWKRRKYDCRHKWQFTLIIVYIVNQNICFTWNILELRSVSRGTLNRGNPTKQWLFWGLGNGFVSLTQIFFKSFHPNFSAFENLYFVSQKSRIFLTVSQYCQWMVIFNANYDFFIRFAGPCDKFEASKYGSWMSVCAQLADVL